MSVFNRNLPISGGNSFNTEKRLAAQSEINMSTQFSSRLKKALRGKEWDSDKNTYSEWYLLNFMATYFIGLVEFDFGNSKINNIVFQALRIFVLYGESGIWRKSPTEYMPYYVVRKKVDDFDNVEKMEVFPANKIINSQAITPSVKGLILVNQDMFNTAQCRPMSIGFGGLVLWLPFVKQWRRILKMGYTHAYSFIKTLFYKVKDMDFIEQELDMYFDDNNPILATVGESDSLLGNRLKEFNFQHTDKKAFFEYYQWFIETYHNILGKRYNVDQKKERNITTEVNASQQNFDIIQREYVRSITDFLNEVEQLTGLKWMSQATQSGGEPQET